MEAHRGLDYRVFGDSERAIVALEGELDIASAPEVEAAACSLLRCGLSLTLDLRGLTFIDSSGLRLLTGVDGRAHRSGAAVTVLTMPGGPVERVMALSGLQRVLESMVWAGQPEDLPGAGDGDARALAVISIDLDNRVTRWNADAERLYGWTTDEARGKSIMQLTVTADTAELAQDILGDAGLVGRWIGEFPAQRRDHDPVVAFVLLAVVDDPHGTPSGMVGLSAPTDHPSFAPLRRAAEAREHETVSLNGDDPQHVLAEA